MKNVLLIRHAKSSWEDPHLSDVDRPLNKRGKRDGAFMPGFLRAKGLIPDTIISSHAKRAYNTATYFADEFSKEIKAIHKSTDLYFGSIEDWMYEINSLDESINFPAFFSHNPTITYMANKFADDYIDNLPTCGVVHLISTSESWDGFHFENTHVEGLYFPKLVRE